MPDIARFKGGPYDGMTFGITIWPPPEIVDELEGGNYIRKNYSQITDEQIMRMSNVARGVEYEWEEV